MKLTRRNGEWLSAWGDSKLEYDFATLTSPGGEWYPFFDRVTHWAYLPEPPHVTYELLAN
jgi:hypothetical protein